jgi:hypothetical protein
MSLEVLNLAVLKNQRNSLSDGVGALIDFIAP